LKKVEKPTPSIVADDSENTSESIKVTSARKLSTASSKTKVSVEKVEEKVKEKEKSITKDEEISNPPSNPPATPSVKKEKPKKKPPENKKKKEEPSEKKEVIIAAKPHPTPSGPTIPDDIPIEIDDRLKVYYRGSSDYEAKVLDITVQDGKQMYRVHYKGWNARYDEWIHRESIAENLTKDEVKKKQSNNSKGASTAGSLQTPSNKNNAKRARNRADTTASSRSTTPLSNTSSKTKTVQKRPTRGTPTNKSLRQSLMEDNSSDSDENQPIKKPTEKKDKVEEKSPGVQKTAAATNEPPAEGKSRDYELSQVRVELKNIKDNKQTEKAQPETSKSDDEKSTKSSVKSGKSPFDAKGKLKVIQRDSSRSSFHSSDSDSSHSVPSDVPNSSKSAYTSENESNDPEKVPAASTSKTDIKKSAFRYDEESNDVKSVPGMSTFFEKVTEKVETKPTENPVFTAKKPNIFQEKKQRNLAAAAAAAAASTPDTTKLGRFGQLEKTLTKDFGKGKGKEVKVEEKSAESDIYEFKDTEEFSDSKASTNVVKKQESPSEPTKKQQLAQQRKQARALQKEANESAAQALAASGSMEDIESMIKTSIVPFPTNKKQKKSPVKEEKAQQSMIMARTTTASQNPPLQSNWDIYSKSNITQPTTPRPTVKSESTFDVLRKSPSFNLHLVDDISVKGQNFPLTTPSAATSSSRNITGPVKFGGLQDMEHHELIKPIMVPSKEDEKPELEAFKKILDPTFEILPKQERSTSIADKLLKAINQKEADVKEHAHVEIPKEEIKIEEHKIEPYSFKAKSPVQSVPTKKPLLISSEIKVDEKAKGNVELQGIIQKLESAIATPITTLDVSASQFSAAKKPADDSDTDSDRLVIEDEATETVDKKKSQMGVLESIMMQEDVPYKHNAEKKSESGEQTSETMSLLLCEETIPGSPAPASVKDPLSEIGRSPTSSSGGFVHPPTMPQSSSYSMKYSSNMPTALLHQQYQSSASHQTNLKSIPMDIDTDVGMNIEAATGDILRDKLKSDRGSATSSGNNTNNNSDDSIDNQSESEKNGRLIGS
jgi:RNA binding activity-knot of a chromodomain